MMPKRSKRQIGDGPIQPDMREHMNDVARALDRVFNGEAKGTDRKVGFVLLTFPFGATDGRCNYISNGARDEIRVMLREQLARWEGQPLIDKGGRA